MVKLMDKKHRCRFDSARDFVDWYNRRIHGALDMKIGETPSEAFVIFFRNFEE